MITFLIVLHVIICILLVMTVLLQFGKGAEMGAIMGGGASQAVFSSSAKGNFMTKLTSILAIGFMVNSIVLTTMKSREAKRSLFDNEAPVAAPLNSDVQALDKKGLEAAPANDPNTPVNAEPAAKTSEPTAPVPATKATPNQ
jgi:preprotein translocase subunit SecG